MSDFKKNLSMLLAATMLVGLCFAGFGSELKADENDFEAVIVEQEPDIVKDTQQDELSSEPVKVVEEIVIDLPTQSEETEISLPEATEAGTEEQAEGSKAAEEEDKLPAEAEKKADATAAEAAEEQFEEQTEEADSELTEEADTEIDYSKLKYSFVSDHAGEKVEVGTLITLTAKLEGFEGLEYSCFWEYSEDGKDFTVAGEGESFSFEAAEDNADWLWRLVIELPD